MVSEELPLDTPTDTEDTNSETAGQVYLVGAGPGDPDLLTKKAERLIHRADVVLHDSLVPRAVTASATSDARVISVGKRPSRGTRTSQEEIHHLMAEWARRGATVVRLKGGDPTVFGRGGEEAQYLAKQGIPFELVPGVSSVNMPGLLGIPLTHREHASSLIVITGHEDPTKKDSSLNWGAIAEMIEEGGTLIVLMGVSTLENYTTELIDRGVNPNTPAAMIQKVTWQDEQIVTASVEALRRKRDEVAIEPPAITVVGEVVSVRDDISEWLYRSEIPTTVQPAD